VGYLHADSLSDLRPAMDSRRPKVLRDLGFTIDSVIRPGPGWILITLTR
jgi:hypothetical protein